ncbi:DUF4240 domain-containing protein [Taibaiella sp. KBW10]|uniref:DUF4240 domain-containing protein n=1 Tax=Taibaiella sp. KBW10 TaxID=2153357 RepID=UPI000F5A00BE|nr:DUF4240 domain-containing protein [Taibaiella sp. KBW10]
MYPIVNWLRYGLIFMAFFLLSAKGYAQAKPGNMALPPGKIAPVMNELAYWEIINQSLLQSTAQEEQEEFLSDTLAQLSPEQLIGFKLKTDQLLLDAYNGSLWCAAYLMKGGCGEEDFTFFRYWLITRGKKIFDLGISHADDIAYAVQDNINSAFDFEALATLPAEAFKKTTQKEMDDYIDYTQVKTTQEHYPPIEITWREQVPATMQVLCPKLYQLFWTGK